MNNKEARDGLFLKNSSKFLQEIDGIDDHSSFKKPVT